MEQEVKSFQVRQTLEAKIDLHIKKRSWLEYQEQMKIFKVGALDVAARNGA